MVVLFAPKVTCTAQNAANHPRDILCNKHYSGTTNYMFRPYSVKFHVPLFHYFLLSFLASFFF